MQNGPLQSMASSFQTLADILLISRLNRRYKNAELGSVQRTIHFGGVISDGPTSKYLIAITFESPPGWYEKAELESVWGTILAQSFQTDVLVDISSFECRPATKRSN